MEITIFADGGSRGNPGPAACGAVLYDSAGSVLREVGIFLGVATNNVAEWQGLIEGLQAAHVLGAQRVKVRLDSELVVKQMHGEYRVKQTHLIPLHKRAKELVVHFAHVEIRHVRREQNTAADALVNRVLDMRKSLG
jgi:ribonuclease HI